MSTRSRPVSASEIRPGPTSRPASRSTRPNVTTWRTKPPSASGCRDTPRLLHECDKRLVPHRGKVLVVLQHRAERLLDRLRVEILMSERGKRPRPVDRLRDAGRLRELEPAHPLDERRRLGGEPIGDARDTQRHNLDLALQCGMTNPVEQATPLERVVQLA